MACCTPTCKKVSVVIITISLILSGILFAVLNRTFYDAIRKSELALSESSITYDKWIVNPIPIYFEIFMFNWTNSEEVLKDWSIKPKVEELGPYTFLEDHKRVNLKWNDNNTVTYQQTRVWHFIPEMSNGTLEDPITNINPVAATIGYFVRDKPLFQYLVDVLLLEKERSLALTKTVRELLFDGYQDEMLDLVAKLNLTGFNIPFDQFAWFYKRNGSASYDGTFNMYTGKDDLDLLGIFEDWNGRPTVPYYSSYCGYVNGTSGELWPPIKTYPQVTIFAPDICSSLTLGFSKYETIHGVEGRRYISNDKSFDNGSKYPEMECFSGKDKYPSGIRDVSQCKYGAPAFVSYPHFLSGDSSYRDRIDGMHPNASLHSMFITIEPETGIPLDVSAQLQLNLLVDKIEHLTMFKHVERTFMPMLWFRQWARLTPDLADQAKLLLNLPSLFEYTGYGLLGLGVLFAIVFTCITLKKGWKGSEGQTLLKHSDHSE